MTDTALTAPDDTSTHVVHALLHGQPLCGFSTDVPGKWPRGNLWLGVDQLGLCDARGRECPTCLSKAKAMRA